MGSLVRAVIFRCQSRRADHNIAYADLAAAVALSVEACKAFYQHAGKVIFACHEYIFVRDEYIVKDNQGFLSAELLIAEVDVRTLF